MCCIETVNGHTHTHTQTQTKNAHSRTFTRKHRTRLSGGVRLVGSPCTWVHRHMSFKETCFHRPKVSWLFAEAQNSSVHAHTHTHTHTDTHTHTRREEWGSLEILCQVQQSVAFYCKGQNIVSSHHRGRVDASRCTNWCV